MARAAALVGTLLVPLGGCGASDPYQRVAVEGQVTLDSRPLPAGRIVFRPIDGNKGPQAAGEIKQGKYRIEQQEGPVCGPHEVQVFADEELPYDLEDAEAHAAHVAAGGSPLVRSTVDKSYNVRTVLQATPTTDGPNRFDFPVRSAAAMRR